jgi:uncharacterized membrane protein YeaQ/YmgE (transglycosylase-associated protein family)
MGVVLVVLVLIAILAVAALVALIALVGNLIGIVLTLAMAALVGALADALVPGTLPYGFLGSALSGLVGSWLGVALLGVLGPVVFGIPLISALVGAVVVTVLYALLTHQLIQGRA